MASLAIELVTDNVGAAHLIRVVIIVSCFVFAMLVAAFLTKSSGLQLLGRVLLVLFSFSTMLGQVARYDEPLKWNVYIVGVTLIFAAIYGYKTIKEYRRDRHRS